MKVGSAGEARIILVRHGHVEDNSSNGNSRLCGWLDPPLSPKGQAQAIELARHVASRFPAECLYTSTLRRSLETAHSLAAALALEPHPLHSLREINCGRLEGWRLKEIQLRLPDLWQRNLDQQDDGFRWPGGESYLHFRSRVVRATAGIAARHLGDTVVLVTHAGVVSQLLGAIHGTRPAQWELHRPSNASITEVLWRTDGTASIVRFNEEVCAAGH